MQALSTSQPIRLADYLFTTAEACRMSGLPEKSLRNWLSRGVLPQLGARFGDRLMFSLIDVLRFAALHDLTSRVLMPPADAAGVAELAVRQIVNNAADGIADVNAVPATLALAVAWKDGTAHVQLVDPAAPRGYAAWQGEWGRAHVVLPIAGLLANVLWRAIDVLAARQVARRP
jgi:Helix-turn-helix domain